MQSLYYLILYTLLKNNVIMKRTTGILAFLNWVTGTLCGKYTEYPYSNYIYILRVGFVYQIYLEILN